METLKEGAAALGVELTDAQLAQFRSYHSLIVQWNDRANLVSTHDWETVRSRHILDSLTVALAVPPPLESRSALDIGSGAGFPGMALKIAFPELRITLLEATAKKTAFLDHVAATLGLGDVDVLTGRAEDLAHDDRYRGRFGLVLARAVARMAALAELTLPFCEPEGLVVAHKGARHAEETAEATTAIASMGGALLEARAVPGFPDQRAILVVLQKVGPTPETYPRRPGIPSKQPILAPRT